MGGERITRGRDENGEMRGGPVRRLADVLSAEITPAGPPPGGCYWPLADAEPLALTDEQVAEFRRRFEQANTPAARAKHMRREVRRLLSRRARFRLWRDKHLTSAGAWLCAHGRKQAAVRLWKVTGLWSGPAGDP